MRPNSRLTGPIVALLGAAALTVGGGQWAGAAAAGPRIVASPDHVNLDTSTHLTGTGFAPDTKLEIVVCAERRWKTPTQPCETSSTVHPTTDGEGRFTHAMKIGECNETNQDAAPALTFHCYVGEEVAKSGSYHLVGATQITVTERTRPPASD